MEAGIRSKFTGMMKQCILVLLALLCAAASFSQKNTCNCSDNLDTLIHKTEQNYAGYPSKITAASLTAYRTLTKELKAAAQTQKDPKACYYLLESYVRFFKDKHFIASYHAEKDIDSLVVPVDEAAFKKYLKSGKRSSLEGIWISSDSSTTIALKQQQPGLFQGVRLASTADQFPVGFVYFTIQQKGTGYYVKKI